MLLLADCVLLFRGLLAFACLVVLVNYLLLIGYWLWLHLVGFAGCLWCFAWVSACCGVVWLIICGFLVFGGFCGRLADEGYVYCLMGC